MKTCCDFHFFKISFRISYVNAIGMIISTLTNPIVLSAKETMNNDIIYVSPFSTLSYVDYFLSLITYYLSFKQTISMSYTLKKLVFRVISTFTIASKIVKKIYQIKNLNLNRFRCLKRFIFKVVKNTDKVS